jgi:hypothetical protein
MPNYQKCNFSTEEQTPSAGKCHIMILLLSNTYNVKSSGVHTYNYTNHTAVLWVTKSKEKLSQKSKTLTNGINFQTRTWTVVSKFVYVAWSWTVLSLTQLQALSSIKTSQRSFSSSITTFWRAASSRRVCNQVENTFNQGLYFQNRTVVCSVRQIHFPMGTP